MATTFREAVDIVNESLATLGYEYQIDTTSESAMEQGLRSVGAYAPSQRNAIMEQMNLVIQQRNFGVMFDSAKNKFRNFLVDLSTEGFGIEDVFHELLEGREPLWDKNATAQEIANDLVSYDDAKIHKFFHTARIQRQFKATIDERNYDKVFTRYGVVRYIDTKLANLSWSAEKWLMDNVIGIVKKMIEDEHIVFRGGHNPNTKNGVDNIVEDIKATMAGFLTPCALYNFGVPTEDGGFRKVVNMTDKEDDIFLIVTPEFLSRIKVQGYSNAFNLSQYEIEGRVLYLPAGTDMGTVDGEKVLACAIDRRAILVGIRRWIGTSFFVPNASIVNHWLSIEGLEGYNTVFNAVAFTGESIDDFFANEGASISITSRKAVTVKSNGINVAMASSINAGGVPFYYNAEKIPVGSAITIINGDAESIISVDNNGEIQVDAFNTAENIYPNSSIAIN